MDGDGYNFLVDHPDGASHFGAWIAIVEIAAKQTPRGTIPQGIGGICQTLSRISHIPGRIFQDALPRLVDLGWIEEVQDNQQPTAMVAESADVVADVGRKVAAHNITLQDITEQTPKTVRELSDIGAAADRMYAIHPKKKDMVLVPDALTRAVERARKGNVTQPLQEIELCHRLHTEAPDWKKDGGRYAPSLPAWLSDNGFTVWPEGKGPSKPCPKGRPFSESLAECARLNAEDKRIEAEETAARALRLKSNGSK